MTICLTGLEGVTFVTCVTARSESGLRMRRYGYPAMDDRVTPINWRAEWAGLGIAGRNSLFGSHSTAGGAIDGRSPITACA